MVRGWAIEEKGAYRATLVLDVAVWRGNHDLRLMIHPDLRGRVERLLVSHALRFLSRWRAHPIEAQVRTDHQEAITTLQRHGFVIRQVLDLMGLELVKPVTVKVRSRSLSAG
jgi:GNAT superfamily N-acetyltransferase